MVRRPSSQAAGFTMLELLLVVVILAMAASVAVPIYARSFRGARLRVSTRTVLLMHRHAQTKAVLGQRYMALLFDARNQTVELVDQGAPAQKKDAFFGAVGSGGGSGMGAVVSGGDAAADASATAAPAVSSLLVRKLEDGVKIDSFRGGRVVDELYYVTYHPSGVGEPYTVTLGDNENRTPRIRVDGVTGKATVEHEH